MATTWQATAHLFAVPATRHVFLVEEFAHHRLRAWETDRIAATLAYDLPVDFVCRGQWIADALAELRPDARALVVEEGLDRTALAPPAPRPDGAPLRVAVDDRRLPEGEDSLALAALGVRPSVPIAEADVVLHLDPVGGTARPVLEAMARGAVPIVLPAGGAAQVVAHDVNGIVAEPDDAPGVARWIETLQRDPERLARLRAGAAETAAAWPDPAASEAALQAALEQLVAEPPPAAAQWPTRLMADAMASVATFRNEHFELGAALERLERDEAYKLGVTLRNLWRAKVPLPVRKLGRPFARRARSRMAQR